MLFPEFPDFRGTRLSLSQVCWRSGAPVEGEQASISEAVAALVPRRNVIQCCGVVVGKGALSANLNFFDKHTWATGGLETQFWVEGGVNARIVEKICLSGEERLFRKSWVIS